MSSRRLGGRNSTVDQFAMTRSPSRSIEFTGLQFLLKRRLMRRSPSASWRATAMLPRLSGSRAAKALGYARCERRQERRALGKERRRPHESLFFPKF
jgi:hypothetical protein